MRNISPTSPGVKGSCEIEIAHLRDKPPMHKTSPLLLLLQQAVQLPVFVLHYIPAFLPPRSVSLRELSDVSLTETEFKIVSITRNDGENPTLGFLAGIEPATPRF